MTLALEGQGARVCPLFSPRASLAVGRVSSTAMRLAPSLLRGPPIRVVKV